MSSHPCFLSECRYYRGALKRNNLGDPCVVKCSWCHDFGYGLVDVTCGCSVEVVKNETL